MTINAADIKLLESEVMTDATDGGGRRTTRVIPDGVAGNVFPKVSRLDTVYGRLNLRKVYGHVGSANVDTYAGAHAIVTDPPDNAKIGVLLFGTDSDFDRRASAKDRIESYVVSGPEARLRLYGAQPLGAKAVLCYQRESESLPDIGDVYALHQVAPTTAETLHTQFVRISSVTAEVREFEDDKGIYKYNIIVLGITTPLEFSFSGPDTPARNSADTRLGKMRITSVADSARYFGIQPLAEPALTGALSIKLPSIHAPLVPTTQREVAVSLARISGADEFVEAGVTFSGGIGGLGGGYRFPGPVLPGTVSFTNSSAGWPAVDDGAGRLVFTGRPDITGAVDYETGLVTCDISPGAAGGITVTAVHAVPVSQPGHTQSREITLATRGSVYSEVLSPAPAPRTTIVDFRALGKWYRLRDETGEGVLTGFDASVGTGTVDYVTGALVVTLGSLPDVDSSLLMAWGSEVHYVQRAGATADADTRVRQEIELGRTEIANAAVAVTLTYSSAPVTVTIASGVNTASNANFSLTIDRGTGKLTIVYIGTLPDPGSEVSISYGSYQSGPNRNWLASTGGIGGSWVLPSGFLPEPTVSKPFLVPSGAPITSLDFGEPLVAGTVRLSLPVQLTYYANANPAIASAVGSSIALIDNGAGDIVTKGETLYQGVNPLTYGKVAAGQVVGSVNYTTGLISITGQAEVTSNVWQPPLGLRIGVWLPATGSAPFTGIGGNVNVTSRDAGATSTNTARAETFTFQDFPLRINLTKTTGQAVVPGSLVFRTGSAGYQRDRIYVDRSGDIVYAPNDLGAGTTVGEINYLTGEVLFTTWAPGEGSVHVLSCVTQRGQFVADRMQFRTAGSPLRSGSLFVSATGEDGTVYTGTADVSGTIAGTLVSGTVNQDMGVVSVLFGEWKPVAGNTGQPWYDAAYIDPEDNTRVWKPTKILPDSLRYSCVVTTNVSLDASILGVDPVRLPLDGRVPMVRPADVGVLHNTQTYALPDPAVASSVYTVGRTGLSDLWLVDDDGVRVDFEQYTVDLDAGTVTMSATLDLTGVPQPLVAKHRISDMVLVSDAQIDGRVDLAAPLTHDYDTAGTYFSTALLFGDLYARVSNLFDQQTWLGQWADVVDGDPADAEFNAVLYPIEVLNNGAVTERWRIEFTSTTAFRCYGENSGLLIATGATGADFGPINPITLEPYFVIRHGGWGGGWAVGNQLRFNTYSAAAPIWLARTILPGAALTADSIDVQLRGDVDA